MTNFSFHYVAIYTDMLPCTTPPDSKMPPNPGIRALMGGAPANLWAKRKNGTRCADPRASILHEKSGSILLYINTPDGPGFVVKLWGVGKGHILHEVPRWTVFALDTKRPVLEKGPLFFTTFLGRAFWLQETR